MTDYKWITRLTEITIVPAHDPMTFSEHATRIKIYDEGGGEFLVIKQEDDHSSGQIRIGPEEWPEIRQAIERMMAELRDTEAK